MTMRALAWVGVLAFALAGTAEAGERVRLKLRSGASLEGELVAHKNGFYLVEVDGELRTLKEQDVQKVEFTKAPDRRVDVDATDQSLKEVIEGIGRRAGAAVTVDPLVANEKVTVMLKEIPWREAVDVLAAMTRCDVERVGKVLYVTRSPRITAQALSMDARFALQMIGAQAQRNVLIGPKVRGRLTFDFKNMKWIDALRAAAWAAGCDVVFEGQVARVNQRADGSRSAAPTIPNEPKPRPRKKGEIPLDATEINMDVEGTSLSDVCEQIGRIAGRNVLVDPAVQEIVTVSLVRTHWREAVEIVARMARCRVKELRGGVLLLSQAPKNEIRAQNAHANDLFRLLASFLGKSLVIGGEVRGPVNLQLGDAFYDEAMTSTAKTHGWRVLELQGGILAVVGKKLDPKPPLDRGPALDSFDLAGTARLSAVILPDESVDTARALLNGAVYKVGDTVDVRRARTNKAGITVEAIRRTELVLLKKSGQRVTIRLR